MKQNQYITDEQVVKRAKAAVRIELEKRRAMDLPIVVYDRETETIYQVNSDGSREKLGKRMTKGRYGDNINEKP